MTYALVSSSDELYNVAGVGPSSSQYQKMMFWSLAPAILVVPIFTVCGKILFGGPGVSLTFLYTVAPVCFIYHVLLFSLAFSKNRKRFFNDAAEYCLSQQASHLLVVYYLCHIGIQLFLSHWSNDQGLMGSVMTTKVGVSGDVSDDFLALFGNGAVLLGVSLLVHVVCFEKIELVNTNVHTAAATTTQLDLA